MKSTMQEFGICNLSLVPLRAEASDKSEMVSQLLFGDLFSITEKAEKWVKIKTDYDDYEGWIAVNQFENLDFDEFTAAKGTLRVLPAGAVYPVLKSASGETFYLTGGSSVPFLESRRFRIKDEFYEFQENPLNAEKPDFKKDIAAVSSFYLQAPYLWGGRSVFGIDCSGFVQVVFKQFNIRLKRDAWQQAGQGSGVSGVSEACPGDLAFFTNPQGRIVHVGIVLDNSRIIHASGQVRMDTLDEQGIWNEKLKRHTHQLHSIRRFNSL